MDITAYRSEFRAFKEAHERERYRVHSGRGLIIERESYRERYDHLWTGEAIEVLVRTHEGASHGFETERAALWSLASSARLGYIEKKCEEITGEITRCERSAYILWDGNKRALVDAPQMWRAESDAHRRHELEARWRDGIRSCQDLRVARYEQERESARLLGFDSSGALHASVSGVDHDKLAAEAELFLSNTAPSYSSLLARVRGRLLHGQEEITAADFAYISRSPQLAKGFASEDACLIYRNFLSGIGVRTDQQSGLFLESGSGSTGYTAPACFPINPPHEVLLWMGAREASCEAYAALLHEGGRAQHHAWTSKTTAGRYPEFIYAADGATNEGFGYLLSGLLQDPVWIAEQGKFSEREVEEIRSLTQFVALHNMRRACAALRFALVLDESPDARAEALMVSYRSLHLEATGFVHHPVEYMLGPRLNEAASELRARCFAAALEEHLRTRAGRRWWASRRAGDDLIDLWNTASRYRVEELASLAGLGQPGFDLLVYRYVANQGRRA